MNFGIFVLDHEYVLDVDYWVLFCPFSSAAEMSYGIIFQAEASFFCFVLLAEYNA